MLNYALTPMLMRDLRSITRGRRPLFVQLAYLALTGLVMVVAALVCHAEQASNAAWGGPADSLLYGQYMFIGIFEAQVVLLALVVISSAAGAVSLEFEKRTYDMLAVTTLTSVELVAGKILSITLLGGMLLFTSLPLAAICLLVGGISPGQIVLCYGLLLAALPLWASSCVLISTLVRRTINSTVVCLVWMVGLIVVASCLSIPDSSYPCVGIMNPMLAVIFDDYASFRVLGHAFPVWAAPLLLDGLLTLFFLVAAAEALPLRQPSRSAVLRLLSMACFFSLAFFIYSAMIFPGFPRYGSNSPPDFWPTLAGGLRNAWVIGIVSLLVVCSYPPPRDAYALAPGLDAGLGSPPALVRPRHRGRVALRAALLRVGAVGHRGAHVGRPRAPRSPRRLALAADRFRPARHRALRTVRLRVRLLDHRGRPALARPTLRRLRGFPAVRGRELPHVDLRGRSLFFHAGSVTCSSGGADRLSHVRGSALAQCQPGGVLPGGLEETGLHGRAAAPLPGPVRGRGPGQRALGSAQPVFRGEQLMRPLPRLYDSGPIQAARAKARNWEFGVAL